MAVRAEHVLPLHRIDAEWYDRLVEQGLLDGQRVELIDGLLIEMSPQETPHANAIEFLTRHFATAVARVRVQLPLAGPGSRPEPDIALTPQDAPRHQHPSSAFLVVEVAASSHRLDRVEKASLYARMGVPDYWVVDLTARTVEVRRDPSGDGYAQTDVLTAPATVAPLAVEHPALDLAALFAFALPDPLESRGVDR